MTKSNAKTSRRAFVVSILALVLCCAMLIGTTLAWFTDTATSGKNQIVAGNLDIELEYLNEDGEYESVVGVDDLFSTDLWEPGKVVYHTFKAINAGTLALKYEMYINFLAVNNFEGRTLDEVINVAVVDGEVTENDRDVFVEANLDKFQPLTVGAAVTNGTLLPGNESDAFSVVLYWQPADNDNDYNVNNENNLGNGKYNTSDGDPLAMNFSVALTATQVEHELDSFGDDYDANATMPAMPETEAVKNAVVEGAKKANEDLKDLPGNEEGDLVYFDPEGLTEEDNGTLSITLHFEDGSEDLVLDVYEAVRKLIGTAVNNEVANIYSIQIGTNTDSAAEVRVFNGQPIENDTEGNWVEEDLKTVMRGAVDTATVKAALEAAQENGLEVTIVDMSGNAQVYKMNFELFWLNNN